MNSQLASLLKKYIENTINGLSHQSEKLYRILSCFASKQNSYGIAIAKMIALLIEYPITEIINQNGKKQRSIVIMAKILECFAPLLDVAAPLSYLVTRNFQKFITYCQKQHKDKNIKDLTVYSHGLYPPNDRKGKGSIFSFHSQKNEPCEGNPNWLYSRYVLATWYNLHKNEMCESHQQIYSFLISSEDFFGGSNILNKLWGIIYRYYTQKILDHKIDNTSAVDNRFITWSRIDSLNFRKSLLDMQFTFPQQSKLLYYLVLHVLELYSPDMQLQIKQIYTLFTNSVYQDVHLQLIGNIIFLRVAKMKNLLDLQKEIQIYGQKLVQTGITDSNLYLPLFYNNDQILYKLIHKNAVFSEVPLSQAQKRQISFKLFQCHKLTRQNLQFLLIQHFKEMFSTKMWQSFDYLEYMLDLMQTNKEFFVNKLMSLAEETQVAVADKQFELFLQTWKSLHIIVKSDDADQIVLERVLALRKNDLRKKYHFMIVPRELPEVVFRILLAYSKYFGARKSKLQVKGKFKTLLSQFQENSLPELLSLVNQGQRDLFWKEWITVINADGNFVQGIINAAQHSTQG